MFEPWDCKTVGVKLVQVISSGTLIHITRKQWRPVRFYCRSECTSGLCRLTVFGFFSGFPSGEWKNMPTWTTSGSAVPGSMQIKDGAVANLTAIASNAKLLFLLCSFDQEMLFCLLSMGATLSPVVPHCYQNRWRIFHGNHLGELQIPGISRT